MRSSNTRSGSRRSPTASGRFTSAVSFWGEWTNVTTSSGPSHLSPMLPVYYVTYVPGCSALLIVFMLAAPIATAQTQPVRPALLDKDYVIGPKDVLDIQYWGSKDLNQTVFV